MHSSKIALLLARMLLLAAECSAGKLEDDDTASIVSVAQTMNLYSYLIDTNQSSQLGRVFAQNATVDFSLPGMPVAHGLSDIIQHVDALSNVTSQHALTTNFVELQGEDRANASTTLTATFFGSGEQLGEIYVVYGR
jgi:hypothetical protein